MTRRMEFMRIRPDHISAVRSKSLGHYAQIGLRSSAAWIGIPPGGRPNARNLLLGFYENLVALGHGPADLHQVVDGRGNAFERLLQGGIRDPRDIAHADQFGLKLGELDQRAFDQVFDRAGVDSDLMDRIPDCILAHDYSFPGDATPELLSV